jgi:hypothetical protein
MKQVLARNALLVHLDWVIRGRAITQAILCSDSQWSATNAEGSWAPVTKPSTISRHKDGSAMCANIGVIIEHASPHSTSARWALTSPTPLSLATSGRWCVDGNWAHHVTTTITTIGGYW